MVETVQRAPIGKTEPRAKPLAAAVPTRDVFSEHFGKLMGLSQFGFPFSIGPYPTAVSRFRALARRSRFAGHRLRGLANLAMTLTWPLSAVREAVTIRKRMRTRGQTPHGYAVLLDMIWLALRHSVPPIEYGLYRFNDPTRREEMHDYLYTNDLPGLAALNARNDASHRDVQDKSRFAHICTSHGFAHIPTLAVFRGGKRVQPLAPFVSDVPAIWTKAIHLKGGAGGAKWVREGDSYRSVGDRIVPTNLLEEELRKQDCLVQPFVDNHPDIARLSNGALASLRIVTGMKSGDAATFISALLCLPFGQRQTSVGGIMCAIDRASGRIVKAALSNSQAVTAHPDTGAAIVGAGLPYWAESMALVERAHSLAFSRFVFLGWDVALTPQGPVLLEANSGWGAIFHQMLDGPIGHTAFGELVSQHV